MSVPARAAFLGLVETAPGQVQAYEDWHADDHLPENLALPGVVHANRWIAPPAVLESRAAPDPALRGAQFLIAYLFADPLEESLAEWVALERKLRAAGRMFAERTLQLGATFVLEGADVAPGLALSAEALVHRRHRGVHLHLAEADRFGPDDASRWQATLSLPRIAGGLRLTNNRQPEYGTSRAGRAELLYTQGDPLEVFAQLPHPQDTLFAGAFCTPPKPFPIGAVAAAEGGGVSAE